jgi:hypothetical protein
VHFEDAMQHRQWFGKIGTNQNDLEVAILISLATGLEVINHHERFRIKSSFTDHVNSLTTRSLNSARRWWLLRRARQILADDLSDIEDLYIRNTDSLIEYPTFGSVLAAYPTRALKARINYEGAKDDREQAKTYYQAYLGENLLRHGDDEEGMVLLQDAYTDSRQQYDELLRLHLLLIQARAVGDESRPGRQLTYEAFKISPAAIRNYGLKLVVNFSGTEGTEATEEIKEALGQGAFAIDNTDNLPFLVSGEKSGGKWVLQLTTAGGTAASIRVVGEDLADTVNKFSDAVFSEELS